MTQNPPPFPPVQQWPVLDGPDCPFCARPDHVRWAGPATYPGAEVTGWECRNCLGTWTISITHWPVLDGPDCPHCLTPVTCWAAIEPDHHGDLWTCEHGHEFVLTPEGLVILPEDAA
ncbi:hypothetical protein [Actinomadura xylanilytica]|uniref:hypothetical protein n=1 Tax=Actinomadura xylanilytica TaxID=887459 RepID=UPI00255A985D|nr:hypothetical protein [Actinomadura xylanilytica]MDL4772482.1 hypothetical protein [Actinomadura xylanilytica]